MKYADLEILNSKKKNSFFSSLLSHSPTVWRVYEQRFFFPSTELRSLPGLCCRNNTKGNERCFENRLRCNNKYSYIFVQFEVTSFATHLLRDCKVYRRHWRVYDDRLLINQCYPHKNRYILKKCNSVLAYNFPKIILLFYEYYTFLYTI